MDVLGTFSLLEDTDIRCHTAYDLESGVMLADPMAVHTPKDRTLPLSACPPLPAV